MKAIYVWLIGFSQWCINRNNAAIIKLTHIPFSGNRVLSFFQAKQLVTSLLCQNNVSGIKLSNIVVKVTT